MSLDRRSFLKIMSAACMATGIDPATVAFAAPDHKPSGPYRPGRIENEYSLLLPGEAEALAKPPVVARLAAGSAMVRAGEKETTLAVGEHADGWMLLEVGDINGVGTGGV